VTILIGSLSYVHVTVTDCDEDTQRPMSRRRRQQQQQHHLKRAMVAEENTINGEGTKRDWDEKGNKKSAKQM
jgi:hypothetical protein